MNTDDVLLHKPHNDVGGEMAIEIEKELQESSKDVIIMESGQDSPLPLADNKLPDIQIIQEKEKEDSEAPNTVQENQTKPSTAISVKTDLGQSMKCNFCHILLSEFNVMNHAEKQHGFTGKRLRAVAKYHRADPNSLFANVHNLKKGDILLTRGGKQVILEETKDDGANWIIKDSITGLLSDLNILENLDMTYLNQHQQPPQAGSTVPLPSPPRAPLPYRMVGPVSDESQNDTCTEVNSYTSHDVLNQDETTVTVNNNTFLINQTKVFFTAEKEQERIITRLVNIPRSRHGEEQCLEAKKKELQDFSDFDVYEIVDIPKDARVIGTEWVIVEKENNEGNKVLKARLCARGDLDAGKHIIPVNAPTANKITIKVLLTLAASQGYEVRTNDVRRAFLQTEDITRTVYIKPPVEAGLPPNKGWLLHRAVYGLEDASRAYFLRHSKELKKLGLQPQKFDPVTFVKFSKGKLEVAYASHVDDCLVVGDKDMVDKTHTNMSQQLQYGDVQTLPTRFLGMNLSKNVNGDIIIDQKHYLDELEVPDMQQLQGITKTDILPDKLQSTFMSLASKLNMLALSSRPDFTFAAK